MFRLMLLFLLLSLPERVTSLDAVRHSDGTVTLTWTLPVDATVVGVTLERDRLDGYELEVFQIVGLLSTYTDATAQDDRSYRYWVHTRNAADELSAGMYVEVWAPGDHHHRHWECHASAAAASTGWSWGVWGVLLLAAALLKRRR